MLIWFVLGDKFLFWCISFSNFFFFDVDTISYIYGFWIFQQFEK